MTLTQHRISTFSLLVFVALAAGLGLVGCAAPEGARVGPSAVSASLTAVTPREATVRVRVINRAAQPVYINRIDAALSGPDGLLAQGATDRVLTLLGQDDLETSLRLPLEKMGDPLANGPLHLTGELTFGYSGLLQSREETRQGFRLRVAPSEQGERERQPEPSVTGVDGSG
ncbi:MAG: hypothetical protein AAF138_08850 [Planctomycetota bacterium]